MASLNHIHTYVKYKKRPGYWRCSDPHCTHILDHESVLGKASHCTLCGSEIILTREDLRRVKPRCMSCSNTAKAKITRAATAVSQDVISKMLEDYEGKE